MHRVLERQLRRHFGSLDKVPVNLKTFMAAVEQAYEAADADRALLERSLELTSDELLARNEQLQAHVGRLEAAQAELHRGRERYRRIVETASEGILLLDPSGRIEFGNQAVADMLHADVAELIGQPASRYLPAGDLRRLWTGEGADVRNETEIRRTDGQRLWMLVSAAPWPGEAGPAGWLLMLADVTARHTAEDRLRRAYEELQELVENRTQFINNTAHELATPLTPIILQISILKKIASGKVDPAIWDGLLILERNLDRLSHLTADVLDAARIQARRMRMDRETFDLSTTVRDCVSSYAAMAERAGITLETSAAGPIHVEGDPHRLAQVLVNLLSNAIKFTPEGGAIRIETDAVAGEARVYVIDSGIGVAADAIPRLFQPFSQVHDPSKLREGGTGLGLYVSRGILEEHNGRIWCESDGQGTGASFGFALPLCTPPLRPSEAQTRALEPLSDKTTARQPR